MADATEESLGIQAYLSTHDGFTGVLKGRFSDFVVHEVGIDGQVAHLTSLEAIASNEEVSETSKRKAEDITVSDEALVQELIDLLSKEEGHDKDHIHTIARQTITFVRLPVVPSESDPFVALPASSDKDQRRAYHHWVQNRLNVPSDTKDGTIIRIWHSTKANQAPGHNNRAKKKEQKPHLPYLQFCLYKENMDTSMALSHLKRRFHKNHHLRIGHAGMKDKRGITTQFLTVPSNTPMHVLAKGNQTDPPRNGGWLLRVGNFSYVNEELKLGRLQGNRFNIALRNILVTDGDRTSTRQAIQVAVATLEKQGFVNYFGTQRFGKYQDTHLTGVAILKNDFAGAIDTIMRPKEDEPEQLNRARKAWMARFDGTETEDDKKRAESSCAQKLLRDFANRASSETSILHSLARHPLEYDRAFSCINKTMRMMFIHAFQSYLWNHAASYRIRELGSDVLVGDLVMTEKDGCSNHIHTITEKDIKERRFTLSDVVLPLLGLKTKEPQNETSTIFEHLLKDNGLERKDLGRISDKDFNISGDYRKLVCVPTNVLCKVVTYNDPIEPLITTDLMKLKNETTRANDDDQGSLMGAIVSFTLPTSAYATIALRELMKRPTSADFQTTLGLGERSSTETTTE